MKIELELRDPNDVNDLTIGKLVLFFRSNIDNRGITKCYVGFYDGENWRLLNNEICNVSFWSYLPKPREDKYYLLKYMDEQNT